MKASPSQNIAFHTALKSLLLNTSLAGIKLFAGIFANSSAMISDAVHSAADVMASLLVIAGVNMSKKKSDANHPYGYERFECVASIILSMVLFITGISIGYNGIKKIAAGIGGTLEVPGLFALLVAATAIISKEMMFHYTMDIAKKVNSSALLADAWHHRTDSLSSTGSLIGILGARLGFPILDPIACVIICLLIIKASVGIFIDSAKKLSDCSCDNETLTEISGLALSQNGVDSLDLIKTRLFGAKIYVDIEIGVNAELSVAEAHDIAHRVHDEIEQRFDKVKHCMVHVNPAAPKTYL